MRKSIQILLLITFMFLISSCGEKTYVYFNYNCKGNDYHKCELKNNKINCEIVTPTCEGYIFKGWYKANEYEKEADLSLEFKDKEIIYGRWKKIESETPTEPTTPIEPEIIDPTPEPDDGDVTIPEEKPTYVITFNANGGNNSGLSPVRGIKHGDNLPKAVIPTREGYTFNGWYDSASGGVAYYNAKGEALRTFDKETNMTLYAQWKKNILTIEYNGAGGTWNNTNSTTYGVNEYGTVIFKSTKETYKLQLYYGEELISTGLTDCNGTWFNWKKDGYKVEEGKEYYIEKGNNKTPIDQNKVYKAVDLANYGGCNLSKESCNITVKVNWKKANAIEATCTGEYENGDGLAKLTVSVSKGKVVNYKFLLDNKVVKNSSSSSYKANSKYTLLINPEVILTESGGESKIISCSVNHVAFPEYNKSGYKFSKNSTLDKSNSISNPALNNRIEYYLYIPESAGKTTKEMPLIIGFHGGESSGIAASSPKHGLLGANARKPEAIIIAPTNVAGSKNWEDGMYSAREIIYSIVKKYNIDLNRVVVNGGSQGGFATFLFGFLEEQVIYYANNDISLETVANQYGTTAEQVKEYNKKLNISNRVVTSGIYGLKFTDNSQTTLKQGSVAILRSKNSSDQRSMVSILIPNSPAANLSRCAFSSSNVTKSTNSPCPSVPAYTIKTPIWLIVSEEEGYSKIKNFAASITEYYEKNGNDIRYTVLQNIKNVKHGGSKLYDPHETQHFIAAETRIFEWAIKQKAGEITVKNNEGIRQIENELNCVIDTGNTCIDTFKGVWTTIGQT